MILIYDLPILRYDHLRVFTQTRPQQPPACDVSAWFQVIWLIFLPQQATAKQSQFNE
jgi:hypothetical protein